MEFNEKLQILRKQKGLTQEELAGALFVSRTAISKWESARGYPSLDSLKAMAKLFSVTIDELVSGNELLTIAEENSRQKERRTRELTFGLLDLGSIMLLFLPLFRQGANEAIQSVSLLSLTETSTYLQLTYFIVVISSAVWGVLTLTLQSCNKPFWIKFCSKTSLILSAITVVLFIVSMQPYAATLLFIFLLIKALMLIKK